MEIVSVPNQILAAKTRPVSLDEIKNGSLNELILNMKKEMKEHNGVGLAANQIGQNSSIFIIDEKLASEYSLPDVFINPEITEYSRKMDEIEEGCLSIPKYYTNIKRAKKIKIKAYDESGKKVKFKVRGFAARVLQHETDHLNGLTIKDRIK